MLVVLAFAFVAGVLTILSPCTLPVVPLLAGSASGGGRRRIVGIGIGFAVTFIGTTVLLASALAAAGLTTDGLRLLSAILLAIFGAVLVVPALGRWLERRLAPVGVAGSRLAAGGSVTGLGGGVLLGAAIGLIWAPCVGPIMAAVIAVGATQGPTPEAAGVALAYVAGALVPLSLIAGAAQAVTRALGSPAARVRIQRGFGVAMIVASVIVATRLDLPIQAAAAGLLPEDWGTVLTSVEDRQAVADELQRIQATPPPLDDFGTAPRLTGITAWINSDPLTLDQLRGKVVLVHFWTFACINCIHVQPYVKAWYDRYANDGFVVIGVHTPELSFERELDNVRQAVVDDDVRFPVAFDPDYATWHAFGNHYWPAFYFIDKQGVIRYKTAGEGGYDKSEAVIRALLAEAA